MGKKPTFIALVLLILCESVSAFQGQGWASNVFKPDPGKSTGLFPLTPLSIAPELRHRIDSAEVIEDVFKPIRMIPLEFTQSTALDLVRRAIFWNDSWIVLSNDGEVFRFSDDGTFISQIGAKGQGPGEYGEAIQIRITPDGKLAVLDLRMAVILIYEAYGNFLNKINFRLEAGRINPGSDFIWTERSLFLASPTTAENAPPYGILKWVDGRLEPSYGFGDHVVPFHETPMRTRVNPFVHKGFEMADDRIWAAMPYDIDIQVYDQEGRWLAELPKRLADGLHREDFEDFNVKAAGAGKAYIAMMRQRRNNGLVVCGRFVLAGLTPGQTGERSWYLYDDQGNLLKEALANKPPFRFLVGSRESHLVGSHGPEYIDYFFPLMSQATQELYRASGYDPEKPHDNPVLVIGSLD